MSLKKKRQKGILTFDFIFSFMIVIGLMQVYYHLAFTILGAQATQYVMFSSARAYFAGHKDVQAQTTLAQQKFQHLTENTSLAVFFRSRIKLSDFEARPFDELPVNEEWRQKFVGTSVVFDAKMLSFRVPFLGSTDAALEGQGFTANISAFLYREPSAIECLGFNNDRGNAIKALSGKYNQATSHGFNNDVGIFSDNGC
ncbi:MAG: hypothetical protein M9899_01595 [Bdellovibrionaceae bacterium]|nr:hypothetical protein [Pseudobdellovibrionaceae bacterium]